MKNRAQENEKQIDSDELLVQWRDTVSKTRGTSGLHTQVCICANVPTQTWVDTWTYIYLHLHEHTYKHVHLQTPHIHMIALILKVQMFSLPLLLK